MTPTAQRIAIAEACGWKSVDSKRWSGYTDTYVALCSPSDTVGAPAKFFGYVPDYLSDLNAMHEAEKVLLKAGQAGDWRGWDSYRITLDEMVGNECTFHATAAQRAEAFLRTIGKWTDS